MYSREVLMRAIARLSLAAMCVVGWVFDASAACTGSVTIAELRPREEGWIHVVASGGMNMDLNGCGVTGSQGLLLNFNDTGGTLDAKKAFLAMLLAAQASGKTLMLCSTRCDSQHSAYSSLTSIN
jgi:hypothetical protein